MNLSVLPQYLKRRGGPKDGHAGLPWSKHSETAEPPKVVVTESTTVALRRCIVHVLPILTSITIIAVNIRGVYIGVDYAGAIKSDTINILLLQLAAKANEILIVASLGLIILQTVRNELLFGDGLPLGLVGSGLTFSNLEFFFKKEFYGALKYLAYHGNRLRKVSFVTVLVVSGLTAALAGPASAVLLVPHSQPWPAGGTDFFMNGTSDDFWPSDLSGPLSELRKICTGESSASLGICPGGGYASLWEHWGRMNDTNFSNQNVQPYAKDLSGSSFYWPVYSPVSQLAPSYALGVARTDKAVGSYTFLV